MTETSFSSLEFIPGGRSVDDRGGLSYINELSLSNFKRFYIVNNHRVGFVRAWHGHKREAKAVIALSGSAILAAVEVDDWENPSPDLEVKRFVLTSDKPGALIIPAGYANGFKTLTSDSTLMFMSTTTLQESLGDDFRFDARHWDPWSVEER